MANFSKFITLMLESFDLKDDIVNPLL